MRELLARARPADTFVLFIAGHGTHASDAEARYYYLTHGADPEALATTALPFEAFEELLTAVAPRRKLFLMDTCESGERDGEPAAVLAASTARSRAVRGLRPSGSPSPSRPLSLLYDRFIYRDITRRSGAIVFSSSRGGQLSYESDKLQNGFFTEALLGALGGPAADVDRDGRVRMEELRRHVLAAVSAGTNGAQQPTIDRDNLAAELSFALPVVRGR